MLPLETLSIIIFIVICLAKILLEKPLPRPARRASMSLVSAVMTWRAPSSGWAVPSGAERR